jgi:hypothetical protein
MTRTLFLLTCFALPARAEDNNVTIRFLGGAKTVPLADLQVIIREYTGDWSVDQSKSLVDKQTDKDGRVGFTLADGSYYVDIKSAKDIPYLDRPVGFKTPPNLYSRMIKVGEEHAFEFNLADACRLTLRAVDVDTGKGIPGVCFVTENATAELWGISLVSDNLGANGRRQGEERTDENGDLVRLMGPRDGYTYYPESVPDGYELAGKWEVSLPTPIGGKPVEHVFRFRETDSICSETPAAR